MVDQLACKILIAGDGGVGKTTLLYRYKEGRFIEDTSMTLGVEFSLKTIMVDEFKVDLQIWDFGGQDRFRHMLPNYCEGALGALLMVDLTRPTSFNSVEEWVKILRVTNEDLPIILVGTKNDLVEDDVRVDDELAMEIQSDNNLFEYLKTSSKTGENIEKCFDVLVRKIIEHYKIK